MFGVKNRCSEIYKLPARALKLIGRANRARHKCSCSARGAGQRKYVIKAAPAPSTMPLRVTAKSWLRHFYRDHQEVYHLSARYIIQYPWPWLV